MFSREEGANKRVRASARSGEEGRGAGKQRRRIIVHACTLEQNLQHALYRRTMLPCQEL